MRFLPGRLVCQIRVLAYMACFEDGAAARGERRLLFSSSETACNQSSSKLVCCRRHRLPRFHYFSNGLEFLPSENSGVISTNCCPSLDAIAAASAAGFGCVCCPTNLSTCVSRPWRNIALPTVEYSWSNVTDFVMCFERYSIWEADCAIRWSF